MTKEDIFTLARIVWGTGLGKLGLALVFAGLAMMNGLVEALFNVAFEYFGSDTRIEEVSTWFAALALILGFLASVINVYIMEKRVPPPPTAHDLQLYEKLAKTIPNHEVQFLREHDFGNPFEADRIKGVGQLSGTWVGPRFEFNDPEIQILFDAARLKALGLDRLLAERAGVFNGNQAWLRIFRDDETNREISKARWAEVREVNDAASDFVAALDAFERKASQKLAGEARSGR